MGKEHKKKKKPDRSRSWSREARNKTTRSVSRSSSEEKKSAWARSPSREREKGKYSSGSRNRSRSRDRDHTMEKTRKKSPSRDNYTEKSRKKSPSRDYYADKNRKKSPSRDQGRKRSYSRERDGQPEERHRHRSRSRPRDTYRASSRERRRDYSPERSRKRSLTPDMRQSRHRSRSSDRYDKKANPRQRSYSSSDDSQRRSKSKSSKKHRRKKSSSSSSESSDEDSPEDEFTMLHRLQKERERAKEAKVSQKKISKLKETPAEKRLRRLQKKEAKERKRKEKMGWDSEYLHFTNADNPYGDNNLLDTFVWKKKLEKEGLTELTREDIEKQNRAKMEDNRLELEKVKKRRHEREMERMEREKMMELEQRQREAAQFSQFSRQEDQFQLEQARLRSQIRIQDGRAKPIDLLAQYVSSEGDVSAVDVHEPYTHLTGLTLVDLEDLLEDIRVYMQLEKEDMNQWYWTDLTIIVQDELRRLRHRDAIQDATTHRQGIHAAVASDVSSIFHNKTLADLNKLKISIESKLAGPTGGLDIGYWESLLSQLKAHQARARLRERHRDNLRKKLEMLKAEQGVKVEGEEEEEEDNSDDSGESNEKEKEEDERQGSLRVPKEEGETGGVGEERGEASTSTKERVDDGDEGASDDDQANTKQRSEGESGGEGEGEKEGEGEREREEEEEWDSGCEGDSAISASIALYNAGRYSPRLVAPNKLEPGTVVVDEVEEEQRLAWARSRITGVKQASQGAAPLSAQEKVMQQEAQRAMSNEEAQFSVEARLDPQHFLWSDKYRPRKPRYFNRVHTGFEWNKYNQTHYDMDNPPPKIVQGYKFNIFYPDLIDKAKTPQYELIPCTDNKDFAILKFTAGPPYESIAFKIVNREWEYSYKRGFRCQFHNNIFQLWFHFKRYRYRR